MIPVGQVGQVGRAGGTGEPSTRFGVPAGKIDAKLRRPRQEAMVKVLPEAGLAVIVLGAGHDLGPVLGEGTEYIRVEVAAVREALRE
jgi:hypothetical protein